MTSPSKNSLLAFHNALIKTKGIRHATGFNPVGQQVRFKIILECLRTFQGYPHLRITDYGCGIGRLYTFLHNHDPRALSGYTGIDINPKFTRFARQNMPNVKFITGDILEDRLFRELKRLNPTVIVASGVFRYRATQISFQKILSRLFQCAGQGLIFNVLTKRSAKAEDKLMGIVRWNYDEVLDALRYCDCYSWRILNDYRTNDLTVVMRHFPTHDDEASDTSA